MNDGGEECHCCPAGTTWQSENSLICEDIDQLGFKTAQNLPRIDLKKIIQDAIGRVPQKTAFTNFIKIENILYEPLFSLDRSS